MKKVSLFALLLSATMLVMAEGPAIQFEETIHDFETVSEKGGPVKHDFVFENTGDEPLIINNVRATCGCTTPEWTKTPIEPGEKGTITVAYNPLGRPGSFSKAITVTSNAGSESSILQIKGKVENVEN